MTVVHLTPGWRVIPTKEKETDSRAVCWTVVSDITEAKLREEQLSSLSKLLHKVNEELEERVKQRTLKLEQAITSLNREISERTSAEEKLELSAMVFENASEGVIVTSCDGLIQYVNPSFSKITGYSREEAIGHNPGMLRSDRHDEAFYADMWRALTEEGSWKGELWNRHKNGELYVIRQSINAIKDSTGKTIQYGSVFQDITGLKKSEEDVQYHAYHDLLTGLPNRTLFIDRLKQAIARNSRDNQRFALLFADIDDFKKINDNFGHSAGDLLIKGVAMRLTTCVRETDTVARYAGDEFLIIAENISNAQSVVSIAEKILESFSESFLYRGQAFDATVSVGIAIYPTDGDTGELLVKNADLAMYHVKGLNKNNYSFFTKSMNEEASRRFAMERRMREALDKNEFIVYYQPKVSLSKGRITGLEALVRWKSGGALVSPAAFIPLAEETGLIVEMGAHVMRSACRQLKAWHDKGHKDLSVSVNIAARQLDEGGLLDMVRSALEETGLAPERLCLEVTESAIMKEMDMALTILRELKTLGVKISLDDFGTGYSSLSHVRKFPLDELKIDRLFIVNIPTDPGDTAMTTTIISMAQNLKLKVVAEGVETDEQLEFLRSTGCDEIQGFYFSPPVPPDEIDRMFTDGMARPVVIKEQSNENECPRP